MIQPDSSTNSHLYSPQMIRCTKKKGAFNLYCRSRPLSAHLILTSTPLRDKTHTHTHTRSFCLLDLAWAPRFGSIENIKTPQHHEAGFKDGIKEGGGQAATLTLSELIRRYGGYLAIAVGSRWTAVSKSPMPKSLPTPPRLISGLEPPLLLYLLSSGPGPWQLVRNNRLVGEGLPGRREGEEQVRRAPPDRSLNSEARPAVMCYRLTRGR